MTKKIFIYTRFNNDSFNKFVHITRQTKQKRLTKAWMEYRMELFMRYTLSSLKQQTNSNFNAWVIYDYRTKKIIHELLARYDPLPDHVRFVSDMEQHIRMSEALGYAQQIYIANLDSDDMYHQDYIQRLWDLHPRSGTVALINQKGYIWDIQNHALYKVRLKCPSFFTLIYNRDQFLLGKRYDKPRQNFALSLPHLILPGRNYILTLHHKNTVSHLSLFQKSLRRKIIDDPATMQSVIQQFKAVP